MNVIGRPESRTSLSEDALVVRRNRPGRKSVSTGGPNPRALARVVGETGLVGRHCGPAVKLPPPWAGCGLSRAHSPGLLAASRRALPALYAGAREAGMAIVSPVRGLRTWRGWRSRLLNLPNPEMETGSSLAMASPMVANTPGTARWASALVSGRSPRRGGMRTRGGP